MLQDENLETYEQDGKSEMEGGAEKVQGENLETVYEQDGKYEMEGGDEKAQGENLETYEQDGKTG